MRHSGDPAPGWWVRLLNAAICALWLWVFLPPMEQLGLLTKANSFWYVFVVLAAGQLVPYKAVRVLLALLASGVYMVQYHAGNRHFPADISGLLKTQWIELRGLWHGALLQDPLQTQIFLLALCAMYWLVLYASGKTRLWVFYNLLAAVVLGIVDGNTPVHPNTALVVVLVACVVVLAVQHYRKLQGSLRSAPTRTRWWRFFGPVSALLALTLVVAVGSPKSEAVWADPLQTINQWGTSGIGGKGQMMIGYQEDNAQLGGSFVQNHQPVLSVVSAYPAYLRGRVYANYTGKGWEPTKTRSDPVFVGSAFDQAGIVPQAMKGKLVNQQVSVLSDSVHTSVLFAAYSLKNVLAGDSFPQNTSVQLDSELDSVYLSDVHKGTVYTVASYEMVNPAAVLQALPPLPEDRTDVFPPELEKDYLSVPAVPDRVAQLAEQIAGSSQSEYDIVTRIEDYLTTNYTYDTQGIPKPAAGQDYVDQFLFDTKKGYCNNFSSSMAVMLRTLGIPTRWVTGFADGTMDTSYMGKGNRYIVQNADAHSWVEVYFPNVGWIPFDPTPGFSIPYIPADQQIAGGQGIVPPVPPVNKPPKPPRDTTEGTTSAPAGTGFDWGALFRTVAWVLAAVVATALLLGLVFRRRLREFRHEWVWRGNSTAVMAKALKHLVRVLKRYGEVPNGAVTLRDLHPVAKSYGVQEEDYRHLLQTAEAHWYGGKTPDEADLHRVRQTWRRWLLDIIHRGY